MSLAGKQTPLSLNVLSSLMQSAGLTIGAYSSGYAGIYTPASYTYGSIVKDTYLLYCFLSVFNAQGKVSSGTYNNIIDMGSGSIRALGDSIPGTFTNTIASADSKYGFVAQLAKQAYDELHPNAGTYSDFVNSYMVCHNYATSNNNVIGSMVNSADFLKGVYSNMDDLTTGDITGVTLSTLYWGQDLIKLGRALDLRKIATFGNPADLLLTLQANNAFTKAVSLALLAAGLTSPEILSLLTATITATSDQQKKIYTAFKIVMGTDLEGVLIPLNCQTKGLMTLADLLDPMKLFPNSYQTLTVPKYNAETLPTNSKTYYLLYEGSGVNGQLQTYGTRLQNVLPNDLAIACDAFSTTMQQIKNVGSMSVQKLAQVVTNLEPMKDLDLNNTDVPTNQTLVAPALAQIANGSGTSGTYTMYDFFGALVGNAYKLSDIKDYILKLQTTTLNDIYKNLYLAVTWERATATIQYTYDSISTLYTTTGVTITDPGGGYGRGGAAAPTVTVNGATVTATIGTDSSDTANYGRVTLLNFTPGTSSTVPTISIDYPPGGSSFSNSIVQGYIDNANTEIAAIMTANPTDAAYLNSLWNDFGAQLQKEIDLRSSVISSDAVGTLADIYAFVDSMNQYATETQPEMSVDVLEKISDTTTVGGRSIIGLMREIRNAQRVMLAGGVLDNDINNTLSITFVNRLGIPKVTGSAIPGSLAGSPETNLIPENLDIFTYSPTTVKPSIYTPNEAIDNVIRCNCDCWDNL